MIASRNLHKSFYSFKYLKLPFARFSYHYLPFLRFLIKKKDVLNGFEFIAESNKITWIIGKNGAGKTTWISIALGILSQERGRIEYDGRPITKVRHKIAIILDNPKFYNGSDGYTNLSIFAPNIKLKSQEVKKILNHLFLDDGLLKQHVGSYSLGQRHRLAMAVAYLRHPEYLFLDEPSIGLDIQSLDAIKSLLKEMKSKTTIVLTSHNFASVSDLIDDMVYLNEGKCEFSGTIAEFIDCYKISEDLIMDPHVEVAYELEKITKRMYQHDDTY